MDKARPFSLTNACSLAWGSWALNMTEGRKMTTSFTLSYHQSSWAFSVCAETFTFKIEKIILLS